MHAGALTQPKFPPRASHIAKLSQFIAHAYLLSDAMHVAGAKKAAATAKKKHAKTGKATAPTLPATGT